TAPVVSDTAPVALSPVPPNVVVPVPADWVNAPATTALAAVASCAPPIVIAPSGAPPVPAARNARLPVVPAFRVRACPAPVSAPVNVMLAPAALPCVVSIVVAPASATAPLSTTAPPPVVIGADSVVPVVLVTLSVPVPASVSALF